MLHEKNATEMNQLNDLILPALFKALSDSADDVVLVDLQVTSSSLCLCLSLCLCHLSVSLSVSLS
jgi:hypothetical protein